MSGTVARSLAVASALLVALAVTGLSGQTLAAGQTPEIHPGRLDDPGEPAIDTRGWRTDFSISSVLFSEIVAGGPPRDGIPAIEMPIFESIDAADDWLAGKAPVIALEIDGDARAYPLAILSSHEIVNDSVGGVPVVVTFCPLCNTALVFERTLSDIVHEFGTTGNLRYGDLIMYDRSTESWWQQATGHAIVGELTGSRLVFRASQLIGLDQFADAWPGGLVLSRDTGYERRYRDSPYAGHDSVNRHLVFVSGEPVDGISPKERVVTVGVDGEGIAIPHSRLREVGVVAESYKGGPIVVFWEPRTPATPDEGADDANREVGSTGVFSPIIDGRRLTFSRARAEGTPIMDDQTSSTWAVSGRAIDGPLAGRSLESIPHGDHYWFAWAAFAPDTRIWSADRPGLSAEAD